MSIGDDAPPIAAKRPAGLRGATVVLVAGAVLGAVVGAALSSMTSNYAVSTLVQAAPVVLGGVDQGEGASNYVRTELLYAGTYSRGMSAAAASASSQADPSPVTVVLRSGTSILSFDGSGPTPTDAVAVANASAQYYVDQWRVRTLAALERSVAILDEQLSGAADGSAEARDLTAQKSAIETQIASVRSAERIVSAAEADSATETVSPYGAAILGALLGACIAAVGLIARRRQLEARDSGES